MREADCSTLNPIGELALFNNKMHIGLRVFSYFILDVGQKSLSMDVSQKPADLQNKGSYHKSNDLIIFFILDINHCTCHVTSSLPLVEW